MFEQLIESDEVDAIDLAELRAGLWHVPDDEPPAEHVEATLARVLAEADAREWDEVPDEVFASGPPREDVFSVADEELWREREATAFALWEQEYATTDGMLQRIVRSRADAARCNGSELRGMAEFAMQRAQEAAVAVAQAAAEGATREELEAVIEAAESSAAAELGVVLHLSPAAARARSDFASGLLRRLPETLKALEAGVLTERAAKVLWEETRDLNVADAARVERDCLDKAKSLTPASFGRRVRKRVEELDPAAARKRHERARTERRVSMSPAGDGMAWISLLLPAEEAMAVYGVIDAAARLKVPGDPRTLDQRKADAAVDLITRPGNQDPRVGYVVHMHGSTPPTPEPTHSAADPTGGGADAAHPTGGGVDAVDAADEGFVQVQGGERIPAARAREKADLTVYHPSVPVDIAALLEDYNSRADVYRPPARLKRAVRARDRHCRFPGCRVPADRCELDHTIAFEIGGRTVYFNLSALCKFHHRIKHMPGWTCSQDEHGVLTWTTPTGQVFITRPPPPVGDEPPDFEQPAPTPWARAASTRATATPAPGPDDEPPF
ncbi:HNH endonuclease signature motif containing protein [Sporichthya polymorpha]|uniref:HNH endonuclease signature motif containing protein n=1 Tax=Sporichthya polymorpha TaxID=35751 RepID=UPI000372A5CB|nr:HNH endonuclease signature motif containing protein [Sporichthya polymorpha]